MIRFALVFLGLMFGTGAVADECRDDHVQMRGPWGEAGFAVEVVDTPKGRSRGLMFRESMPRGSGMLFVYDAPRKASFWMKNTLIPLDMIFVDQTGTIKHVHHRAVPGDLTAIEGGTGIYAVLEINGGLAKRYGIEPGSQMRHPVFFDGPAIWSC